MENSRPRFHITVTDHTTGEIIVDTDTTAILGAVDKADEGTGHMIFLDADCVAIAATYLGVAEVLEDVGKKVPITKIISALHKTKNENKGDQDNE